MKEFKGTKGKWEIFTDSVIKSEIFIMTYEMPIIRIALNNYANEKEAQANAKLIASAPEMFEMLNEIHSQKEDGRTYITKEDIKQLLTKITE